MREQPTAAVLTSFLYLGKHSSLLRIFLLCFFVRSHFRSRQYLIMRLIHSIIGIGLASLASAHAVHRRGTVPVDGSIITSCTTSGVVALSFDDGPFQYTQSIVDQLTNAGHRATFFQNHKPHPVFHITDRTVDKS